MIETLIDHVTANPGALAPGWEMLADDWLVDPEQCICLVDHSAGGMSPPGSYSIMEEYEGPATEYGGTTEHRLIATIWTEDPGVAIRMAEAVSAHQEAEVNPGLIVQIRTMRADRSEPSPGRILDDKV